MNSESFVVFLLLSVASFECQRLSRSMASGGRGAAEALSAVAALAVALLTVAATVFRVGFVVAAWHDFGFVDAAILVGMALLTLLGWGAIGAFLPSAILQPLGALAILPLMISLAGAVTWFGWAGR